MGFTKCILSVLAMSALVSATTARADDDAGEVAGAVMGAVVGGILQNAFDHDGPGFGGPGGPGGWGHPGGPGGWGGPGGGPGWPHPGGPGGWGGPGGGPGWPHPGGPGGWGGPGGFPHPGGPGGFPPPPPPPPPPQVDVCSGIYVAQSGGGDYVQLTEQGRGYINVTTISNRQAYYGSGTCVQTGPFTAQYNFSLTFDGCAHVNQGTIYRANDGRYYLQGTQDNGPVYVYVR